MIPSTARTAHHSRTADHSRTARSAAASLAATGILTGAALLTVAAPGAAAATGPTAGPAALAAARHAATEPTTLDTLARFFAREGAVTRSAAAPRIEGAAVPVNTLDPDFVAGKPGAPVARLDYLATTAVSSDGQKASLWTLPKEGKDGGWQVVNIASGDDETRYAAEGTRRLPGGTVFREPQTDAWFVQKGTKVLPWTGTRSARSAPAAPRWPPTAPGCAPPTATSSPAPDTPAPARRAATPRPPPHPPPSPGRPPRAPRPARR